MEVAQRLSSVAPAVALRMRRGAGLLAVLLLIAAVTTWADDFGGRGTPNPLSCTCTDVDPRESFISTVPFTCWEQYKFGSCNQSFMLDSIKEVSEGYCQISCGRCSCCPSLQEAALQAGLTEFIWAMNRSSSHVEGLTQPGLLATLMAPNDNAMRTLFDKLGGKAAIESNDGVRNKLASIMSYHVVRPVPGYEAFTTPFMLEGVALKTFKNGTDLTVESNTGGNIKVKGGSTSADITQKDIYACKGFINVLNWYLLPPGEELSS